MLQITRIIRVNPSHPLISEGATLLMSHALIRHENNNPFSEETTDAPSNQYLWRRLRDYHIRSTALRRRLRPARQTRGAMGGQGSIAARRARDKPGHQERRRRLYGHNARHASGHGDTTQRLQD